MKNYIVFDLEWNQSAGGKGDSIEEFPFEIIEIGAVKLDGQFHMLDEFHRLIRPQVYTRMHFMISEVTHMDMHELQDHGESFVTAMEAFTKWCGKDAIYCTWGSMDLTELQRNLVYYQMKNPFPVPLFYYDVQKLFGLFYAGDRRVSLDTAVEQMGLAKDRQFHRALDDAYYTGRVLAQMDAAQIEPYVSLDYYRVPENKEEEIHLVFPNYSKYVSQVYPDKEAAMADKTVTEMKCYRCRRILRKKVRWFTPNQKIYYGLAICPEHGYLKGKIRIKKADDDQIYIVKTLKLTDEAGAQKIMERKDEVRKKRSERSKAKKQRAREQKKKHN